MFKTCNRGVNYRSLQVVLHKPSSTSENKNVREQLQIVFILKKHVKVSPSKVVNTETSRVMDVESEMLTSSLDPTPTSNTGSALKKTAFRKIKI